MKGLCSKKEQPSFQGDLSVITIENLMQLVSHAALSGELQLAAPHNSAVFSVHKGILVYAYLEDNPLRIGQQLIQENHITAEQLQESLLQCGTDVPRPKIGKILVGKGYLQQGDLEEAIKAQIKSIFFKVLSRKEGFFLFRSKQFSVTNPSCSTRELTI